MDTVLLERSTLNRLKQLLCFNLNNLSKSNVMDMAPFHRLSSVKATAGVMKPIEVLHIWRIYEPLPLAWMHVHDIISWCNGKPKEVGKPAVQMSKQWEEIFVFPLLDTILVRSEPGYREICISFTHCYHVQLKVLNDYSKWCTIPR